MLWSKNTRELFRKFKVFTKRKRLFLLLLLSICFILLRHFNAPSEFEIRLEDFKRDWCRVRRTRVDWEQILKPCLEKTAWRKKHLEPALLTDADKSFITLWDVRPAGEFSRFSIQSQTAAGWPKKIGGDSWRVHVNGPVSVAGTVFDHMNGTYEVVFLLTVSGAYQVDVVLDHSLCTGFTDPPPHWFVTVIQRNPQMFDVSCGIRCNFLWDGFGNWIYGKEDGWRWIPLLSRDDKPRLSILERPLRKDSALWVYGDSVSEQFYSGIRPHPLCTHVFKWCGHTYNWVYQLKGNVTDSKSTDDNLDFDYMRVAAEIGDVVKQPIFDRDSVILFNAGLHYLESTNFTNYQKTIDAVIRLIQDARGTSGQYSFPGSFIWKTSTALNKQKLDGKHVTSRRFLTFQQRVLLFNAYATSAMCHAGFEVLDVHPLTDSYPYGTGNTARPKDAVHYQHFVFESVERLLVEHFSKATVS